MFQPTDLGLSLVEGYDMMQLGMSKPTLRAHMEQNMKQISIGTKTKEQVVTQILEEMKQVTRMG